MPSDIFNSRAIAVCIGVLMLSYQVCSSPILKADSSIVVDSPDSLSLQALKQFVRMTPLWRNIGTKPHRAYCQHHHECSTKICRQGHCSLNQNFKS
ncbi:liver-expressed antimicrobial peptide 2-like [Acipenser oxyrinchus oxyrinchus]|uniref:Liver-expressed antimicrobial peptide 2-like n=1 Tax=Acipenser oxyrinchus oxyrinchus TaxID=40147 RepID=A0AAD8G0L4_ACIOX|nr:liver-expressed antimicrobial peptide 2-like [Acipenser oxyrinchus oxyrinchus]